MIYFTSDLHYGHRNICSAITTWDSGYRQFESLEVMNQTIVDNINAHVGPEDTLYCLGDWAMGGLNNIPILREQLNVKTLHLILGNHDNHIRNQKRGFQKLFTSVNESLEIRIGKQHIVMHHFPMYVWNKHHKGAWMLHGHCHGSLHYPQEISGRKIMDVGIDAHPDFGVWNIDQIAQLMDTRQIIYVDHHLYR